VFNYSYGFPVIDNSSFNVFEFFLLVCSFILNDDCCTALLTILLIWKVYFTDCQGATYHAFK